MREFGRLWAAAMCANAIQGFRATPRLMRLTGAVQHYDWGGFEFIPSLLAVTNAEAKPFAEL